MPQKANLLIVDDEANTLASLSRAFRLEGHVATVCDNAAKALELAKSREFDLILSDYNLPSFDGIAALRLAREKCPDVPFIIVSGAIGEETAVEALKAGAHDFLVKANLARLAPAIERELRDAQVRRERGRAEVAGGQGPVRGGEEHPELEPGPPVDGGPQPPQSRGRLRPVDRGHASPSLGVIRSGAGDGPGPHRSGQISP